MSRTWTPHKGQKKGCKFLVSHASAGLIADPGVGKTSIALASFMALQRAKKARRALVVAPLRPCYLVWPAEQRKWLDFAPLRMVVLHGDDKHRRIEQDADIYVINSEGLEWLFSDSRRFRKLGIDVLIIDELTKFRHPRTKRFKLLKAHLPQFRYRWGLTGSPAANGLEGLFGQAYMLDLGKALGRYITHFRSKFFTSSYNGYAWTPQKGAEKKIFKAVAPLMLRLAAEDYVDMPKEIQNVIDVELPPNVRDQYDTMEEEFYVQLERGEVVAANAGAKSMKLRQIASGALYTDLMHNWEELHEEKMAALLELIESLQGKPLLVAYEFQHTLDRIRSRIKDVPHIGAGVTARKSAEIESAWNAGNIPVLLGHPQSVGHGLNLQGDAHHVAWVDPTWNYELYDQFNRRVRRQGNRYERVFVHNILARGTVDHAVHRSVRDRERGQQSLFAALKAREWREPGRLRNWLMGGVKV